MGSGTLLKWDKYIGPFLACLHEHTIIFGPNTEHTSAQCLSASRLACSKVIEKHQNHSRADTKAEINLFPMILQEMESIIVLFLFLLQALNVLEGIMDLLELIQRFNAVEIPMPLPGYTVRGHRLMQETALNEQGLENIGDNFLREYVIEEL